MFRFEYDEVVEFHPYRQGQPWDLGGTRLLHVDGVNGRGAELRPWIDELHEQLAREWAEKVDRRGDHAYRYFIDNHSGFTVRADRPFCGTGATTYYQLRFSDGSLYVWLMPAPKPGEDPK